MPLTCECPKCRGRGVIQSIATTLYQICAACDGAGRVRKL